MLMTVAHHVLPDVNVCPASPLDGTLTADAPCDLPLQLGHGHNVALGLELPGGKGVLSFKLCGRRAVF